MNNMDKLLTMLGDLDMSVETLVMYAKGGIRETKCRTRQTDDEFEIKRNEAIKKEGQYQISIMNKYFED